MTTKPTKPDDAARSAGRPPMAPEDRRDILLRVLTNAAEHEELRQAAEKAGAPLGTWARLTLLAVARRGD